MGEVPWLGSVLDSRKCLWILGSVYGFWEVFWILESVAPTGDRIGPQCFLVSSEPQTFDRHAHWKSAKDLRQETIAA